MSRLGVSAHSRVGQHARAERLEIESDCVIIDRQKRLNCRGSHYVGMYVVSAFGVPRKRPGSQTTIIMQPRERLQGSVHRASTYGHPPVTVDTGEGVLHPV